MAAILESLGMHAGLIVSCQADPGSPLRSPSIMAAMARAADMAGAVGIRANGAQDIAAIKAEVRLPVIGINKIRQPSQHPRVYITPSFEAAVEIARLGCEILALHVLPQYDRDVAALKARMKRIKDELDVLLMADIATVEDARFAVDHGADLVATTSYRYAYVDEKVPGPPVGLVRELARAVKVPIIAEGSVKTPADCVEVIRAGAFAVVVGTAITAPDKIAAEFVAALSQTGVHRTP
jgi:N-acylglucosamine-6-phosphate 2-epimerase